jgi:hypothetical protein
MSDVIKINVPTFIRLLELVREEVKNDPDIHDIAEIVTALSEKQIITMQDYDTIVRYMKQTGNDYADPERMKKLGGIDAGYW